MPFQGMSFFRLLFGLLYLFIYQLVKIKGYLWISFYLYKQRHNSQQFLKQFNVGTVIWKVYKGSLCSIAYSEYIKHNTRYSYHTFGTRQNIIES